LSLYVGHLRSDFDLHHLLAQIVLLLLLQLLLLLALALRVTGVAVHNRPFSLLLHRLQHRNHRAVAPIVHTTHRVGVVRDALALLPLHYVDADHIDIFKQYTTYSRRSRRSRSSSRKVERNKV
jgi:hypothetical protein